MGCWWGALKYTTGLPQTVVPYIKPVQSVAKNTTANFEKKKMEKYFADHYLDEHWETDGQFSTMIWKHFFALLVLCEVNPSVTGGISSQRALNV